MADIYEQHAKAFDRVSAFVIVRGTDSTRARAAFFKALAADGCSTWDIELQRAGFSVWQAV